jgi:hypothetical protein
MSIFVKICPMEAELFHADCQTDVTKLTVAVPNFAKALENFSQAATWISKGNHFRLLS